MNENELRAFMEARLPSREVERMDVAALACYGCAHSDAASPPPGRPSGERPCMACIRNPDRESRASEHKGVAKGSVVMDDRGNARCFDPFQGTQYNGVPMVNHPMDRYVTMDQRAQESWLEMHPEYEGAVRFDAAGNVTVVGDTDPS